MDTRVTTCVKARERQRRKIMDKKSIIVEGYEVTYTKDENEKCGFAFYANDGEKIIKLPVERKYDDHGGSYWKVWFGTWSEARNKECNYKYLHRLVFAIEMGWKGLDIMAGGQVHHLDHSPEIKDRPQDYNDISNLIYLPKAEHDKLHRLEKSVKKLEELLHEDLSPERKQLAWIEITKRNEEIDKIISKYIAIKNNTMKRGK